MVKTKVIAVLICTAIFISLLPFSAFALYSQVRVDMDEENAISKVIGQLSFKSEKYPEYDEAFNISLDNINYIGNTVYNGVPNGRLYEWKIRGLHDSIIFYDDAYADVEFRIYYNGLTDYYLQGYKMLDFLRMSLKSYFMTNGYARPCNDYTVYFCNKGVEMPIANYNYLGNPTSELELEVDTNIEIDPMCYVKVVQRVPVSVLGEDDIYFRINLMFGKNYMILNSPTVQEDDDIDDAINGNDDLKDKADAFESEADKVIGEIDKNTMPDIDDVTLSPELESEFESEFDIDIDDIEIDDIGKIYDTDSKIYKLLIILAFSSLSIAVAGYVLHGKR